MVDGLASKLLRAAGSQKVYYLQGLVRSSSLRELCPVLKPSWPRRGRRNEILSRPTSSHTRRVAGIGYVPRWHALYSSSTATGASTSDEPLSEVYDEAVESEDGSDASDACADDLETI